MVFILWNALGAFNALGLQVLLKPRRQCGGSQERAHLPFCLLNQSARRSPCTDMQRARMCLKLLRCSRWTLHAQSRSRAHRSQLSKLGTKKIAAQCIVRKVQKLRDYCSRTDSQQTATPRSVASFESLHSSSHTPASARRLRLSK
jgi:hypothetical protein